MNNCTKKKIGLCLMTFSCLFVIFAFVVKQQTIDMDSPAEKEAKKFGIKVYEANAELDRFMGNHAQAAETIRRGKIKEALKKQRQQNAEKDKEQKFYILLGIAVVTFISGIIFIASLKQDTNTVT